MIPLRNVATAAANLRHLQPQPGVTPAPAEKVVEGVEALSLQSKVDLSQKASVTPVKAPDETRKPKKAPGEPKKAARPEGAATQEEVTGTDFAGRTCTGSLSGPLLMEDPQALEGFNFDHPSDFQALFSAGKFLAGLDEGVLTGERSPNPLASDQGLAYFGVQEGKGLLVQQGPDLPAGPEESQITLPSGEKVQVTRQEGRLSLFLPAESLGEVAQWGRRLLAVA